MSYCSFQKKVCVLFFILNDTLPILKVLINLVAANLRKFYPFVCGDLLK